MTRGCQNKFQLSKKLGAAWFLFDFRIERANNWSITSQGERESNLRTSLAQAMIGSWVYTLLFNMLTNMRFNIMANVMLTG